MNYRAIKKNNNNNPEYNVSGIISSLKKKICEFKKQKRNEKETRQD